MAKAQLIGGPRDGQIIKFQSAILIPTGPGLDIYTGPDSPPEDDVKRWQRHGVYTAKNVRDITAEGYVRMYWQGWQKLGNRK